MNTIKPSFTQLAIKAKRVLILGVGGGGDVILTFPLGNYLEQLGVEQITIGGVASQWWNPVGGSSKENFVLAPLVYDVTQLSPAELLAPRLAKVTPSSAYQGHLPAESAVSRVSRWPVVIGDLTEGVVGLRDSLNSFIHENQIDLFIGADIGAHSFHDGNEVTPPFTTLISFMTLSAMLQLSCPVVYAFAGYTCDAEMEIDELDERIGRIMKAGGFLGAYGLTPQDVRDYLIACEAFKDPIEPIVANAAMGNLGWKKIPVMSPWGRRAYITPLSAIYLFLDPQLMVSEVSRGVEYLKDTRSLAEAEEIYQNKLGLIPETRLKRSINFMG